MQIFFIALIGFLSIFTLLCSCNATNITLSGIEVAVSENFQIKCQNEIQTYLKTSAKKGNKGKYKELESDSPECLRFCGYKQIGMVDNNGNIETSYLRSFIPVEKSHNFKKAVSKCVNTKESTNVCMKAWKNAMCIFARLDRKINILIDLKLMTALMD